MAAFSASSTGASFTVGALGKTVLFFSASHGNQVEFFDQNGNCFLWYPRNSKPVPGRWVMIEQEICFQYGKNTYNPVTGEGGGNWSCSPIAEWMERIVDTDVGDAFGLSQSGIPYKLPAQPKFESINEVKNFSQ